MFWGFSYKQMKGTPDKKIGEAQLELPLSSSVKQWMLCAAMIGLATNTPSPPWDLHISSLFFCSPCDSVTLYFSSLTLLSPPSLFTGRGASTDGSDAGVMEGGDHSAGGSDESPSEAEFLLGREEGLTGAQYEQISPDCSEDMEDSDSLASEQLLPPGSRAEGPGLSFSSAWALAFFGEDCFSPEVLQYAANLGQHTGSPCLDVKTQVGKPAKLTASESYLTFTLQYVFEQQTA